MSKWPKDNQAALIKFYGTPKTKSLEDQLVRIKPPFTLYYDKKPVAGLLVHGKCADAFMGAFRKIWDYYEHDQAEIDRLGLSEYGGAYNPRPIRGSTTRWSNHAYAAAIDISPTKNGFGKGKGTMPLPAVAAFKSEGAEWGGEYKGRTDPMHFEFVDRGSPQRTFEQWLTHYGVKEQPKIVGQKAPHNKDGLLIETTQQRLFDLGYPEVGDIDGVWGGKTAGAIAAFRNDRHLADTSKGISKALLAELDKAEAERPRWHRPISPARADITVAELKEAAPEIVPAEQGKKYGLIAGGVSAAGSVIAAVPQKFNESIGYLETARGFFDGVPGYAWFSAAAAISLGGAWYAYRTSNRIQTAYKTNERN